MKSILAILSFVLLIAFTANAQTETDTKKEETIKIEQSSPDDQSTLSVTEDGKKKCEGKSKEECKKLCEGKEKVKLHKNCEGKEKAEYHKNHHEKSEKECKPDCKKECCTKNTEEIPQTDETSNKE